MSKLVGYVAPLNFSSLRSDLFGRVEAEMDRLFNEAFSPRSAQRAKGDLYPKTDIVRKGDRALEFRCAIPFVSKDDVKIELQEGNLTISGKAEKSNVQECDYLLKELRRSSFTRSWFLGDHVQPGDVKAKFKDGILYVTVENAFELEKNKTHVIDIK